MIERISESASGVVPWMDSSEPVTGEYLNDPRVPLLTAAEVREAVGYLLALEELDSTPRGKAAGDLAHELALRIPAE